MHTVRPDQWRIQGWASATHLEAPPTQSACYFFFIVLKYFDSFIYQPQAVADPEISGGGYISPIQGWGRLHSGDYDYDYDYDLKLLSDYDYDLKLFSDYDYDYDYDL